MIRDVVGVVTNNREKARDIIFGNITSRGVSILNGFNSKYDIRIEFSDGSIWKWVLASDKARCHRFTKAYIDSSIDAEILEKVILPCCCYCKEEGVIYF